MAYGANIYGTATEGVNKIMNTAEDLNNQYRMKSADVHNQFSQMNTNEIRRTNDINARNRAAARNMKSAAVSQISDYAQNKQLMGNQIKSDVLRSEIWNSIASSSMSEADRARIMNLIGVGSSYSGAKSTNGATQDKSKKSSSKTELKPMKKEKFTPRTTDDYLNSLYPDNRGYSPTLDKYKQKFNMPLKGIR